MTDNCELKIIFILYVMSLDTLSYIMDTYDFVHIRDIFLIKKMFMGMSELLTTFFLSAE